MIEINISTEFITSLVEKHKDLLRNTYQLKDVRFVGTKLKANYVLDYGVGKVKVPISMTLESSDNSRSILLSIHVHVLLVAALASKIAAKEVASTLPIPTALNGGTIIIPTMEWFSGVNVLLTDEWLNVKIRPYEPPC